MPDPRRAGDPQVIESGPIDTVLFDVDGTLIDSSYHHALAWARAFASHELYPQLWRVHRAIGMGGDRLVAAVTDDAVEERLGDALRAAWEDEYRRLLPEVRPIDGAAEAVRAVRDHGLRVALASSGKSEFTRDAMHSLGLADDDVDAVTTADDADSSKPAPDILGVALRRAGGRRAALVGDATWDVESAGRLAMGCVGVRTGGFSACELREAGALAVVDSVGDLRDGAWLDDLTAG